VVSVRNEGSEASFVSKKDEGDDVCARPCDPRAGQERNGSVEFVG